VDHRKILHLAHKRRIIIEWRMGLGGNDRSVVVLDVFCIVGEWYALGFHILWWIWFLMGINKRDRDMSWSLH
jgi:hypothetical protein